MCKQLQDWIKFSSLQECPLKATSDRKIDTFLNLWLLHQTVFEVHNSLNIFTCYLLNFSKPF